MTVVFYISGHGFGHASRSLELIAALHARQPACRFIVRTSVPRWFLERSTRAPIEIQVAETDTGMAQIGSLALDEDGSALEAARFYGSFDARVESESVRIASVGASVVVGDVPPLAFAAAARAGVPSVAVANFTWDWIYAAYPQFEHLAPGVLGVIRDAYSTATTALRLPLHGGFEPMASVVRDIPFIARRSRRTRAEVRAALGLPENDPVVLASFGAYGVDMPVDEIVRSAAFTLVVTDSEQKHAGTPHRRLKRLTSDDLRSGNMRYEDVVAAADVVVSKPGYGIVSECIANGAALLYTSRDRFREYDVFVEQMPAVVRCRYLSPEDFKAGRWKDGIERLLAQAPPPESTDVNGAEAAADAVLASIP